MFVLAIGIVSQVAYTQAFESHIWNPENYNITRLVEVDASRGNIYSDDYSLLATSIPEYEIRWDATVATDALFHDHVVELSVSLADLFGDKSAVEYEQFFHQERNKKSRYALVKRKVNYNQLKVMKYFLFSKKGSIREGLFTIRKTSVKNHSKN